MRVLVQDHSEQWNTLKREVFCSLQVKFVANRENEPGVTDKNAHHDTNREYPSRPQERPALHLV